MTRYVIFTGGSGTGKTSAARSLASILRSRQKIVLLESFERPTLNYLDTLLGRKLDSDKMDSPISSLLSTTPRGFAIREAQHMRFTYGPGVNGQLLADRCACKSPTPHYVLVDDGTNIVDLRPLGMFFLVQIQRGHVERVFPFVVPNPNMVIHNDGTLEQLHRHMIRVADKAEGINAGSQRT